MRTLYFLCFSFVLLSYQSNSQVWMQLGSDIDGEYAGDYSGECISMPDSLTIAISSPYNDDNGTNAGHVRIYSWNGTSWIQKGIDIDGENMADNSGRSVSMPDSNTVAIGGPLNDGNGAEAGHVRIYSWNGVQWTQKGGDIDGESAGDQFGRSVSMSDSNTVAIGGPYNDGNGNSSGHVRVYSWNGTSWVQKGIDINGESTDDLLGFSVSMPDSNTVAIGSPNNSNNGVDAGRTKVYSWNGIQWTQKGQTITGETADDWFGLSVSMPDSNHIAIGGPYNDGGGNNSGHVRVYSWDGLSWSQKGVDIDGELGEDNSGGSISMPDSNTVVIGAKKNDGNGMDSGHARIFTWNGTNWTQNGQDLDGEMADDWFGQSVSMSNSKLVAVSAFKNDGNGSESGHVRIFYNCSSSGTDTHTACNSYTWIDGNTYTASTNTPTWTLQNTNGCDSLVTLDLTISNSTTATDIQTACESYTWIDGNTYTASNNTATWTIPNAAGCDSVITLDLTINPLPDNNVTQTGTLLEADQAGATYQWLDCDDNNAIINGETNQSYTPATTGNYAVEVTLNGCADTSSCFLVDYTGMSEIYAQLISIHPNPTADVLTVKGLDQVVGLKGLEITSSNGEIVMTQEGMKKQLNVSALPTGIYFLNIIHESGTETIRFVKQ